MPPETGNLPRCFIGTSRFHVQMLLVGQVMANKQTNTPIGKCTKFQKLDTDEVVALVKTY